MTSNQPEGPVDFYQMCLDYVVERYGKEPIEELERRSCSKNYAL